MCVIYFSYLQSLYYGIVDSQFSNHKKSLVFKYSRMQKKIPPQLVCGSCTCGTCLVNMLPGVEVTGDHELGFFSVFSSFS